MGCHWCQILGTTTWDGLPLVPDFGNDNLGRLPDFGNDNLGRAATDANSWNDNLGRAATDANLFNFWNDNFVDW
eukprot:6299259-Amphidinium_carterae.1